MTQQIYKSLMRYCFFVSYVQRYSTCCSFRILLKSISNGRIFSQMNRTKKVVHTLSTR